MTNFNCTCNSDDRVGALAGNSIKFTFLIGHYRCRWPLPNFTYNASMQTMRKMDDDENGQEAASNDVSSSAMSNMCRGERISVFLLIRFVSDCNLSDFIYM